MTKCLTAKISDFGLSKALYYGYYRKTNNGHLPFKWMSLEAMRDSVFTEKSDVWSFGVCIWEMLTLGSTPYPTVDNNQLERNLIELIIFAMYCKVLPCTAEVNYRASTLTYYDST